MNTYQWDFVNGYAKLILEYNISGTESTTRILYFTFKDYLNFQYGI